MHEINSMRYIFWSTNKQKRKWINKTITGLRRSGKSFLLFKIFYNHLLECGIKEEDIITLALDDDLNSEYRNPDKLSKFLYSKITNKTETFYIFSYQL